ncbi:MAG: HAD-IA family hydrolase [Alphaproteobacteria bacterium]|jgi:FMN phosphatase YigB (HAD superfamily)
MKKTLILDCDGVIYPTSQVSLRDFVRAMKDTARDWKISDDEYNRASAVSMEKKALGMFNFIREMTGGDKTAFDRFCSDMFDKIDYSKITRDDVLFDRLQDVRKIHDVVILTNNHRAHLDKVLQARFGRTAEETGVPCHDIASTEKDGIFYPKQSEQGLSLFADRIGRRPGECILVDDAPVNIRAAKQIGMGGVLITPEMNLSRYLASFRAGIPARGVER